MPVIRAIASPLAPAGASSSWYAYILASYRPVRPGPREQLRANGAARKVADDDEQVAVRAQHARHQLSRAHQVLRHHSGSRDARLCRGNGLMRTARRTTASVAEPRNRQ